MEASTSLVGNAAKDRQAEGAKRILRMLRPYIRLFRVSSG